ncbi:hypothetical protein F4861DRAFT_482034 [Xylaria intraflava]|nr:hypothetical protein F4861DRAFT_482034 [Xylaria intraflava]
MPLHLLGKKSWNVYNPANIARVKRDEAEARARTEAEAKQQQVLDAERRLAILRGEVPPALPPPPTPESSSTLNTHGKREHDDDPAGKFRGGERRKRKRYGEDDTDFEMRMARERTDAAASTLARLSSSAKTSDSPLVDSKGHIALFPEKEVDDGTPQNQKNEEAEREAAKKRRDFEDQYTMRFANAGGRGDIGVTGPGPWYASNAASDLSESAAVWAQVTGKDVWGNDDPKRKARDAARVTANDPLAMMKRGAAKVRDVERERRILNEEKTQELKQLRKEEKRREKRRSRRDDPDELEGFNLDAQPMNDDQKHDRDRRGDTRHRHRSDHDDRHERHRYHNHDHGHGKSHRHNSDRDRDSGERERHSSRQGRRRLAKTDYY